MCRRGDFVNCLNQEQTGTTADGGYAEMAYARASGLVRIPDGLSPVEAAPLLCAGLTTLTAIRRGTTRAGALVAVQGIGGLGRLAVDLCQARYRDGRWSRHRYSLPWEKKRAIACCQPASTRGSL
jgi:alcohol dehydrogenase, propanol-preferring